MHTGAARTLGAHTTSVTHPGSIEHVRTVRADLRALLRDCPRADDLILCASELAANAATHSRSRLPGGVITVRATISPDLYARIEVQDDGGPWNQGMIDRPGTMGWTSSAPLPTSGASTVTAPPGPSGPGSIGPSSRDKKPTIQLSLNPGACLRAERSPAGAVCQVRMDSFVPGDD